MREIDDFSLVMGRQSRDRLNGGYGVIVHHQKNIPADFTAAAVDKASRHDRASPSHHILGALK
jgi:hypothetical protein